ncbi:MAG: hypothetical protein KY395_02155 [Actinobacteria bacterium]|nr:hypothetical protein [Actinomycetota bacterium]
MRRMVLAVLVAGLVGAAACGDDEVADTVTTTTSTAQSPPAVDTTTPAPAPETQSLQSCPGASGNSPATFDGGSGTYAAFIVEFIAADIPLSFDVVQWMTGEAAREAYREDHPEDPEGPPNDYYVRNQSTKTRDADVRSDAKVWLVKMEEDSDADVDRATFEELSSYNENSEGGSFHIFWLTFENDKIVEICEQFRP